MKQLKRVLTYFRPYLVWLMLGSLFMVTMAQTDALLALFVRPMFDKIFIERSESFLWLIPIFSIGLMLFKGISGYFYGFFIGYANTRVTISIRNEIYEKYLGASLSYFDNNPSGELMSRLQNDAFYMQDSVNIIMAMFQQSITFLGLIAVVFYRDWKLALLGLVLIPLVSIPVVFLGRAIRRFSVQAMESMAGLNVQMFETFSGIRVVKAFGLEKRRVDGFIDENQRYFIISMKSVVVNLLTHPVIESIITLGVAAVLFYGGYQIMHGQITPGVLFSFLTAIGLIYDPVRGISKANNRLQVAMASADRVFGALDSIPYTPEKPNAKPLPPFKNRITFDGVSFEYDHDETTNGEGVLCAIDLTVNKGQTVALVGSSGAGKTTMANLIPRFYDITAGTLQIDDMDVRDTTLRSLRSRISVVTQETYLFNDTIRKNIAYGIRKKVKNEDVEAAAKAAYAHDFIMEFEEGYETMVGERGVRLSGGQRQRIAIARALMKDAPILILDEATSSLDTEAEQMVQKAIEVLMKDRTTIVIAHRLSTIRKADLIVVFDKGCIVERGKHDELLQKGGIYKKLYELQFAAEDLTLLGKPHPKLKKGT